MKLICFQTEKVLRCDPVAMATGFPRQLVSKRIGLVPRELCAKYTVLPKNKFMNVCPFCHGNKVSLATTHCVD